MTYQSYIHRYKVKEEKFRKEVIKDCQRRGEHISTHSKNWWIAFNRRIQSEIRRTL